jgi:alpha-ribazole phosphatase
VTDPAAVAALVVQLAGLAGTVWTSPAQRCRLVADALGVARIDLRLQELDFGEWEGLAWDDVPRKALDAWAADVSGFAPPGGESGAALIARVRAFASDLPRGDHVVITHGGPLKVLTPLLRGLPVDLLAPAPALGSITRIG